MQFSFSIVGFVILAEGLDVFTLCPMLLWGGACHLAVGALPLKTSWIDGD